MIDITMAELVEVEIREDGKVLWVNIDGVCQLRVCHFKKLDIKGGGKSKKVVEEATYPGVCFHCGRQILSGDKIVRFSQGVILVASHSDCYEGVTYEKD